MSKLSHLLLEKEILLESGTNELEILVFNVGEFVCGVNVAKVREVLPAPKITRLPEAHYSIRGVFKLRNQVIPCVSLADFLGVPNFDEAGENIAILTDLNQQQTAFLVDRVEKIYRLSWENVLAVPALKDLAQTPVTALARCGERLILMLDFEMILDQVTNQYFRTAQVDNPDRLPREKAVIVLVEDSPTVREAVVQTLCNSGYCQVILFENGREAWQWMEHRLSESDQPVPCNLVIADIEMPQVDGLHLTKRIKSHPQLCSIPVLLYSSIITPENRRKGEAVGADAQVAKPDLCRVVELADEMIFQRKEGSRSNDHDRGDTSENSRGVDAEEPTSAGVVVNQSSELPCKEPSACPPGKLQSAVLKQAGQSTGSLESRLPVANETRHDVISPAGESANKSAHSEFGPSMSDQTVQDDCASCPLQDNQREPSDASRTENLDSDFFNAVVPPQGTDAHLWRTFLRELQRRCGTLKQIHTALETVGRNLSENFDLVVDLARTLHTIKSAAMVIPVHAIVRATHAVESILEKASRNDIEWNPQWLTRYAQWLEMFLDNPDIDWESLEVVGCQLAEELEQVAASAPTPAKMMESPST